VARIPPRFFEIAVWRLSGLPPIALVKAISAFARNLVWTFCREDYLPARYIRAKQPGM
jgi:hypothetical protein